MTGTPWPSIADHWKGLFGRAVWRVSLDAGFGCPNRETPGGGCYFCDPASFSPSYGDKRTVEDQLKASMKAQRRKGRTLFAAYFQPRTNTYAPLHKLREAWDAAAGEEDVKVLCIGTRPDCVGDEVLDLLAGYSGRFDEIWLELGLQSANDGTLRSIGRGHTAACFADAVQRAKQRSLKVCAHVILGLPGEDWIDESLTADFLRLLAVDGVKLHQLSIVEGTEFARRYLAGELRPLESAEYIHRAVTFIGALPGGTVLHRVVGDSQGSRELAPNFDKSFIIAQIRAFIRLSRRAGSHYEA